MTTNHAAISAPEAESIFKKMMLPALQMEHGLTKNVIAAVPTDKGDYRPSPIVKTALDLAWHIAAAEHRFLDAVAAGKFNLDGPARPDDRLLVPHFDIAPGEEIKKLAVLPKLAPIDVGPALWRPYHESGLRSGRRKAIQLGLACGRSRRG